MAATFAWKEDNGTATSGHGTTAGTTVTTCNWKNLDVAADTSTNAYSANPITAGNNSYAKYQWGAFSGTYNQLSAGLWAHTAGVLGTGVSLVGKVTSTYATPSTTALAGSTDMTSVIAIGSGQTVLFSTDGNPYTASPQASVTNNPAATQYLVSQLQTTASAAAGDLANPVTLTLQYSEN